MKTIMSNHGEIALGRGMECFGNQKFFNVRKVSDKIQQLINAGLEVSKAQFTEDMKDILEEKGYAWGESGVDIQFMSLRVDITEKKEIETLLLVGYVDKENSILWNDLVLILDTSESHEEIKELLPKKMKEKYFK